MTPRPHLHSCQKKWIDLFFVLAFVALRKLITNKVFTVSLSGCVKTSSKVFWERVLNDNRDDHSVQLKQMEKLLRKEKNSGGTLKCMCTYPCNANLGGGMSRQFEEWEVKRIEGLRAETEMEYWDFED